MFITIRRSFIYGNRFDAIGSVTKSNRYISLERLVEQNKDRYYETLEQSSQDWHEGRHDPSPYINYMLSILKTAYREFAERVGDVKASRGTKRDQVAGN